MSFISDFISGFKDYVIQTWKNRPSTETPVSAERLNHIEAGIKSISDAIKNMASAVSKDLANMTIGASNWDAAEGEPGYVQNRTHWKEYVSKQETILEETSVSFSSNMTSLYGIGTDTVAAGKPYIVHWNDAIYECTAFYADQSTFLGNGALTSSGDDTGEPFCMEMLSATSAFVMKATKDAETIKIKVETPEVVKVHKMDKMYMPDDYEGGGGSNDFVISCEEVSKTITSDKTFDEILEAFTDGKNCIAMYKGYRYSLSEVVNTKTLIRFARYVADYTSAYPDSIKFHKLNISKSSGWNYTTQTLPTVLLDVELLEDSHKPVWNSVITKKFNDVDANIGVVASVIDSIMESTGGSELNVVKDETKAFPIAEGVTLYKCSDSAPSYADMSNGLTVIFGSGYEVVIESDGISDMGNLVGVTPGEGITIAISVLADTEVVEGMTLSKGFYVMADIGDGMEIAKISIPGYSFGTPMIKPECLPVNRFYAHVDKIYKDEEHTQIVTKDELRLACESNDVQIVQVLNDDISVLTPIECYHVSTPGQASYVVIGTYNTSTKTVTYVEYYTDTE